MTQKPDDLVPLVFAPPPLSMTIADAAEQLGVSRATIESLIKSGEIVIHQLRPGGDRRISYWSLIDFVKRRESAGISR